MIIIKLNNFKLRTCLGASHILMNERMCSCFMLHVLEVIVTTLTVKRLRLEIAKQQNSCRQLFSVCVARVCALRFDEVRRLAMLDVLRFARDQAKFYSQLSDSCACLRQSDRCPRSYASDQTFRRVAFVYCL